jgi:hypothetical protein
MREFAESFRIREEGSTSATKFVAEPLLRYADATRQTHESALWICGAKGRPVAVMATEYYPNQPKKMPWLFEIASLSPRRIHAERAPELEWLAEKPGLSLQEIPEGSTPADQPARRMTQMKQLMRRFTAHESAVIEGRVELRPLTNALHRYEDPSNGLVDGAIFAFANGTNPEVFVLLEAHATATGKVWKYSMVQMTGGALNVSLDGKEIWSCTEADPPAVRASYVNGWVRLD